jgi:MoxR-like ATPase
VRAVAAPVLRHRLMTNFNAEAEGIRPDDIVARLAALIPQDPQSLAPGKSFEPVFKTA